MTPECLWLTLPYPRLQKRVRGIDVTSATRRIPPEPRATSSRRYSMPGRRDSKPSTSGAIGQVKPDANFQSHPEKPAIGSESDTTIWHRSEPPSPVLTEEVELR